MQKVAVVDLETTGHSFAKGDRIIQLAITFIESETITTTYSSFFNPERAIPAFIQQLTGISDEDVKGAPLFREKAEEIAELLAGCSFAAHNAAFDLPFIQGELACAGQPPWRGKVLDTVELARILFPKAQSFRLADIASELGIPLENAHRADADAEATARLLLRCIKKLQALPEEALARLHSHSFALKSSLSGLFFEELQKKRRAQASPWLHLYKGFPLLPKDYSWEPLESAGPYPAGAAGASGPLAAHLPNFEARGAQQQMMDAVARCLGEGGELMVEAATGTGKTLAYLLPAYYHAAQSGRPVVISTYTGNLLDQLLSSEVPKLARIAGRPVRATALKGLRHYIDLEKFARLAGKADCTYDESFTAMQLIVWLLETETGDLAEVNVFGGGHFVADRLRRTAPVDDPDDFHFYARWKAQRSHFIATNHAMLLLDAKRRTPLFASASGLVIDEAHQMVQAAYSQGEIRFRFPAWKHVLGQLGRKESGSLLARMAAALPPAPALSALERAAEELEREFDAASSQLVEALRRSPQFASKGKASLFLEDIELDRAPFKRALAAAYRVAEEGSAFFEEAHARGLGTASVLSLKMEFEEWRLRLLDKADEWHALFLEPDDGYAFWAELDKKSVPGSLQALRTPLRSGDAIGDALAGWRGQVGVVWTSGTLTVRGGPDFMRCRLGVGDDVPFLALPAPAPFYQGASVFVVEDMPDVQQVPQSAYVEAVADAIVRTARALDGRCFALFTSQEMLRQTVALIEESALLEDFLLLAQGVSAGSRSRLLSTFGKFPKAVLFGTGSFWEGVDVPGESLAAVIAVRLPFSSPEEPLFRKRAEQAAAEGKNAFSELSLPEAILRFRQGFGRLIRSSADRGAFLILDKRIDTKAYGSEFLQALPRVPIRRISSGDIVKELEHWYNGSCAD